MNALTISDAVLEHARVTPAAPALSGPDFRLNYRELADRMLTFAGALESVGVAPGNFVICILPNGPMAVIASLAAQHLGACSVELGIESAGSIAAIVEQTGARHLVVWGRDLRRLAPALGVLPRLQMWIVQDSELGAAALELLGRHAFTRVASAGPDAGPKARSIRVPERDASTPAMLVYTSGSTTAPRAVVQTVGNVLANTRSIVEYLELGPRDRASLILPLHYCYGKSVLSTHFYVGASVFLDHRFVFPRVVVEAFGTEKITGFAGVPLTFELIRRQLDPSAFAFPALRYVTQAGGPMHPDTIDWVRRSFAPARLFVMYGQTEATARLGYLPPERADKRGSIGIAIPGVELSVVDEDGRPVADGVEGHLVARGDNVCAGYFQDSEGTREILRDGRLWTGDLAVRDAEGFLFLVGRAKEIMKIGGHRVSPTEIEETLCRHPDVAECGVTSVLDDVSGEAAVALVVRRPGSELEPLALRKFCAERQPPHKVPKNVLFVASLPRNSAGKLLRPGLRELIRRTSEGEGK